MKDLLFVFAKIKGRITGSHEAVNDYYRHKGVKIGKGCLICSNPVTREPFLVEIGENTTISTGVSFITHDNSVKLLFPGKTDVFGKITIGDNCFIGQNSTLLYGVTISDNVIIAAGSVVTRSITESNVIYAGNPAKKIGNWDTLRDKLKDKVICRSDLKKKYDVDNNILVEK